MGGPHGVGRRLQGSPLATGLLAVVVLASLGRALYVTTFLETLEYPEFTSRGVVALSYDEFFYRQAADRLARGKVFELRLLTPEPTHSALHPPMTSVFLTPASLVGGGRVAMRLTGALAGAAVVAVVGLVAARLRGPRAGLIAAGIAAVYPNLWVNDGLLLPETYAALTTAVVLLCAFLVRRRRTVHGAVVLGVACGVAALTRSELLLLLPLLAVPAVVLGGRGDMRRSVRLVGATLVAAAAVMLPWVAYNLSRFERPVLISTGDGPTLAGANCDETYSGKSLGFWDGFCGPQAVSGEDESVHSVRSRRYALQYIRRHLDRLPVVVAARVGRVWSLYRNPEMIASAEGEGKPRWAMWTGWWSMYLVIVPLGVVGAVRLRRRRDDLLLLLSPVAVVFVTAAAFYGRERFRVPAEVSLVVLAGIGSDAMLRRAAVRFAPIRT